MTETYESIQADASGPGTEEWRQVDRARVELMKTYRDLADDGTRSEEFKREMAHEAYEKTKARVEELAPEARRKMLKTAEGRERMSIPTPEGEGLVTKDTNKLLLTSHERSRIEGLLSRSEETAKKGPLGARRPADIIRGEYERGLDEGGPQGGATVRACVGLVRDLGLDISSVVDGRRRDSHRSSLEGALEARQQADLVSKAVPAPPYQGGSGSNRRAGTYNARPALLGSGNARGPQGASGSNETASAFTKKRRPLWK